MTRFENLKGDQLAGRTVGRELRRYFGAPGLIAGMGINLSGAFIPSA
jgi:hypothetical protein